MSNDETQLLTLMCSQEVNGIAEQLSAACFESPINRMAYEYALAHWKKHQTPIVSGDLIREYPGLKLDTVVEEGVGALVERLQRRFGRNQIQEIVLKVGHDSTDPTKDPAELLRELAHNATQTADLLHAPEELEHRRDVDEEKHKIRVRLLAKQEVDQELRPVADLEKPRSLDELLAKRIEAPEWVIDRLVPNQSRIILSAAKKSGKTTVMGNLTRALVDGDAFLDQFEVREKVNHLVLLDNEMSELQGQRWLAAQNIKNTGAVADVQFMRGQAAGFDITNDKLRGEWGRRLGDLGCDYIILDCLRPVLDAIGLDENREVGTFLVAFDELLWEAGISNALICHHMGHNGERARGDSRIVDWSDANWKLVRQESNDDSSPRYFSAYGRDVNVPEGRLVFDPVTRHLTYSGESRKDVKAGGSLAVDLVIHELAKRSREIGTVARMNVGDLQTVLREHADGGGARNGLGKVLQIWGIERGLLEAEHGSRGKPSPHWIKDSCPNCWFPVAWEKHAELCEEYSNGAQQREVLPVSLALPTAPGDHGG